MRGITHLHLHLGESNIFHHISTTRKKKKPERKLEVFRAGFFLLLIHISEIRKLHGVSWRHDIGHGFHLDPGILGMLPFAFMQEFHQDSYIFSKGCKESLSKAFICHDCIMGGGTSQHKPDHIAHTLPDIRLTS